MRVGNTGDSQGQVACTDAKTTVSSGYMSPYPPGLELPDLDAARVALQMWAPAIAAAGSKPVGKWTIIKRPTDASSGPTTGTLYTSVLDHRPGMCSVRDSFRDDGGDDPAVRVPIQPPSDVPPAFAVSTTRVGRLLETAASFSVYASDGDGADKSNCNAVCAQTWTPMLAPASVRPHGDWTIIERSPGVPAVGIPQETAVPLRAGLGRAQPARRATSRAGTTSTYSAHRRRPRSLRCRTPPPDRCWPTRTA